MMRVIDGMLTGLLCALLLVSSVSSDVLASNAKAAGDVAFEGTQEAGGPVRLALAADGSSIVEFEAEGVAGGGCSWDTLALDNWGGPIALTDGQFRLTNADGDTLSGGLVANAAPVRRFEGTVQVRDPSKGCETPALYWAVTETPGAEDMP